MTGWGGLHFATISHEWAGAPRPPGAGATARPPRITLPLTARTSCETINQMVNRSTTVLDGLFGALADPTRRAIVRRLRRGEASVSEIAAPLPMSAPAVSRHLRILEGAGLVERRVEGRVHHLRLVPAALSPAAAWIEEQRRFWADRLDALAAHLEQARPRPTRRKARRSST